MCAYVSLIGLSTWLSSTTRAREFRCSIMVYRTAGPEAATLPIGFLMNTIAYTTRQQRCRKETAILMLTSISAAPSSSFTGSTPPACCCAIGVPKCMASTRHRLPEGMPSSLPGSHLQCKLASVLSLVCRKEIYQTECPQLQHKKQCKREIAHDTQVRLLWFAFCIAVDFLGLVEVCREGCSTGARADWRSYLCART